MKTPAQRRAYEKWYAKYRERQCARARAKYREKLGGYTKRELKKLQTDGAVSILGSPTKEMPDGLQYVYSSVPQRS